MKFIHSILLSLALTAGSMGMTVHAQNEAGYLLHTVKKGQSLYSIASMYNVSVDELIRLNPGSEKRIRTGKTLRVPQISGSNQNKPTFHTIQAGETLYQLTLKYQVTAKAICSANPGLSAQNFRIGQIVAIPPRTTEEVPATENTATPINPVDGVVIANGAKGTANAATKDKTAVERQQKKETWREMHKVKRRETIYSISKEYDITEEELIAANPELKENKLKRGSFLFIPYKKVAETKTAPVQTVAPTNEELFSQNTVKKTSYRTIKAAVMLPFMTGDISRKDEQTRMVEYYEGFLMAVDSLKRQGVSVDLHTFDTKGREATINNLLARPEMKKMDIIFGPTHPRNIDILAQFANKHDIRLVVPFAPKVEQVFNNPQVYQVNTPQSYLYSEVYEHFIRKFSDRHIIFINPGNVEQEKLDFINGMKNELKDNGILYREVTLGEEVDPNQVISAMDTLANNIFVPTSGKNRALVKLLPRITQVLHEHPHFQMQLFGYPEWQTYTQDHLASFYELDTYFYSSFYTNNLFKEAIQFANAYRRWYSKDMANIFPKYGMLGFDTGYFFLKGLAQEGNKLEENLNRVQVVPIQTGFKFERVNNWGGFINRKVFFVHFSKEYELIKLNFE